MIKGRFSTTIDAEQSVPLVMICWVPDFDDQSSGLAAGSSRLDLGRSGSATRMLKSTWPAYCSTKLLTNVLCFRSASIAISEAGISETA